MSLGILFCSEAERLAGRTDAARSAFDAADAITEEGGAEPNPELGLALTRVRNRFGLGTSAE